MSLTSLDIATDVRVGLTSAPKQLPPRLFYDAAGSELFEEITRLPEYYLTRTETEVLRQHAEEILSAAGEDLSVVELGAGSATKTRLLLEPLMRRQKAVRFVPVDVSPSALEVAAASVRAAIPGIEVEPLEGRYRIALGGLRARPGRKLVLFIGSSIGNFDPDEALELLRDFRSGLRDGDSLLLGCDLVKDAATLIPAYDDAAGVTARFNKNILARINRELGGSFALEAFRHVAIWNAEASRIEMHLESAAAQRVRIEKLGLDVELRAGERIHTENSYKFRVETIEAMLRAAGFQRLRMWTDPRRWFALHLAST